MLTVNQVRQRDWMLLMLVLLVAAVMRLSEPGIVEFFHDDAMVSSMAQEMVSGETLPLTGIISSVGIPNPPMTIYVLAIPFLLSTDPAFAILFIMIFNVVGVGLLWWIAHRYFGRYVALVAGLTYAVSPWAVLYSRKIWAQDYHTPFILFGVLLGLYGFLEASKRTERAQQFLLTRQEWAQVLCLPVLLIGMQIHFAAWLLLPLYPILLMMGWRRMSFRALFVSAIFCGIVLLPYAVGLAQTLDADPGRITAAMDRSSASTGLSFGDTALRNSLYLITGYGLETWFTQGEPALLLDNVPTPLLWWGVLLALIAGMSMLLIHRDYRRFAALLLAWGFFPVLAFTPQWTPVYPHYFVACLPVYALLAGIGIDSLLKMLPQQRIAQPVLLSAYTIILLTQVFWWRGALRFVDSQHMEYPQFTTPMHYLQTIENDLQNAEDVIIVSYGMAWNQHHESVVWDVLLEGDVQCVRTIIGDGYAVFPENPFTVMIAPDAPENPVRNLYTTDTPEFYPERPGGAGYTRYDWETPPDWTFSPINPIDPATFDMGVELTGYYADDNKLALEWRLPDGRRGQDYQFTAQFFDANGERVGQYDNTFWHGRHWCPGDRLITYGDVETPENAVELHVGLYQFGTGRDAGRFLNASVIQPDAAPGQSVIISLTDDTE